MPVYKIQNRYQDSGWEDVLRNDAPSAQLFTRAIDALRIAEEWSRNAVVYGMCRVVNVRHNSVLFEFAAGHEPLAVFFAHGQVIVHPVAEGLDPREVELEMSWRDIHSEMAARAFPDDPTPDPAVTAAAEDEFRRAYGPRGDPVVTEEDMRRFMDRSPSDPLPVRENQSGDFAAISSDEIEQIRIDVLYGRAIRDFIEGMGSMRWAEVFGIIRDRLWDEDRNQDVGRLEQLLLDAMQRERREREAYEAEQRRIAEAPQVDDPSFITMAQLDAMREDQNRIAQEMMSGLGLPPHLITGDNPGPGPHLNIEGRTLRYSSANPPTSNSGSVGGEVPAATAEDWANPSPEPEQRRPRGVNLSRRRGDEAASEEAT